MQELEKITPKEQDFGRWFTDVVKQGNLIDYGPVKGTMVFKPLAYGIWENIQHQMNKIFRKLNIENVYLPLLIPEAKINQEKEHVEGFSPELVTITKVGQKQLVEPLVIRPTSETLFCEFFAKAINSYQDLPLMFNQWANVMRWEKTTTPFLRNSEFLWQEGHTVHENATQARQMTRKMLVVYQKFIHDFLAIPTISGKKTIREKFAGAKSTYTIEAMMGDGRALQAGTSHYLGQNFSRPFNITYLNQQNKRKFVYQTSWGISTRLIGAIIMTHGDNRGIIVPPKIAFKQIDILELFAKKNPHVHQTGLKIFRQLSSKWRVNLDTSHKMPGFKASQSEIQGTPLRIEIGPRDLANNLVTLVRRDTLAKQVVKLEDVKVMVKKILHDIQQNLLKRAQDRMKSNLVYGKSYEELKLNLKHRKFVIVPFAGTPRDEKTIQEEIGATVRCIPHNYRSQSAQKCIYTQKLTKRLVIFAKAY